MNLTIQGMKKIKILFLYSELAEYFVACIRHLEKNYDVEIHLVRWRVNSEAPFSFTIDESAKIYHRDDYNRQQLMKLAKSINPHLIYCSGWMDRDYLAVCKAFKEEIPIVVGLDNHWTGSLKQQLAKLINPFTFRRWFTHAWVAGSPQRVYAKKIGFHDENILEGVYSADVDLFHGQYHTNKKRKNEEFPHRFLYVGRYNEDKGVRDMIDSFTGFKAETKSDWELWCCGTGPLRNELPENEGIKHFGFVQPAQLAEIASETGVFVLPSHYEPWGVVVHEFAAAGFPLICTEEVGAISAFLEEGINGFTFAKGDRNALSKLFIKFSKIPDSQLNKMGENSYLLSKKITPSIWSKNLLSVLNEN